MLDFRENPRARPPCRKPSEKPLLSFRPSEARGEISVINIVLIVFYCLRRKNTAMTAFFKRFLDCARRRLFTPFGSCRAPLEMTFPAPTIFNNLSRFSKIAILEKRTQFVAYLRHLPFPVNGSPRQGSGLRPRTAGECAARILVCP